jgi:hypothetical protein
LHDGTTVGVVSTRTLLILAAITGLAILVAFAVQVSIAAHSMVVAMVVAMVVG